MDHKLTIGGQLGHIGGNDSNKILSHTHTSQKQWKPKIADGDEVEKGQ